MASCFSAYRGFKGIGFVSGGAGAGGGGRCLSGLFFFTTMSPSPVRLLGMNSSRPPASFLSLEYPSPDGRHALYDRGAPPET